MNSRRLLGVAGAACLAVACGQVLGLGDYEVVEAGIGGAGSGASSSGGSANTGGATSASGGSSSGGTTGNAGSSSGGGSSGGSAGVGGSSGGSGGSGGDGSGGSLAGAAGEVGSTGGTTSSPKRLGEPCSDGNECDGGKCVDGVCCATVCDGTCESCAITGSLGQCSSIDAGEDPEAECQGHVCDGNGSCGACNNGRRDGDEQDVDCGGSCLDCPGELLLTELVDTDNSEEYIEIHNPGPRAVTLEHVYLADFEDYFRTADPVPDTSDFRVRFPAGASIDAGEYIVISMEGGSDFADDYGFYPDYDLDEEDATTPAMLGRFTGSTTLSNTGEMVMLFFWDGVSDLVRDIDYVVYEPSPFEISALDAVNKSGQTVGSSTYVNETLPASQSIAPDPDTQQSLVRCDSSEGTETQTGGNGFSGQDETSENLAVTWLVSATRTPGAANVCD